MEKIYYGLRVKENVSDWGGSVREKEYLSFNRLIAAVVKSLII